MYKFKLLKKVTSRVTTLFLFLFVLLSQPVFASSTGVKLIDGTVDLANQATTWLLVLIPVTGAAFFGYHAWMRSMADDSAAIAERNQKMKSTLIWSAVAMAGVSIFKAVMAFYQ